MKKKKNGNKNVKRKATQERFVFKRFVMTGERSERVLDHVREKVREMVREKVRAVDHRK